MWQTQSTPPIHPSVGACSYLCMAEPKRPTRCRIEAAQRRWYRIPSCSICCSASRNRQIHPSNIQWPRKQLLPRSHDLPSYNHPTSPYPLVPVFSPTAFRIRSVRCSTETSMVASVRNLGQPRRQTLALLVADQPRSRHTAISSSL
jgi:hypothetical protein